VVRIGIMGCGRIARRAYLPAFQKCDDAEVTAADAEEVAGSLEDKRGPVVRLISGSRYNTDRTDIDTGYR